MTDRGATPTGVLLGLLLAGAAVTAAGALVVAIERARARPAAPVTDAAVAKPVAPAEPIPEEAGVFRTRLAMLAIGDPTTPRRNANPRTLHSYRVRRAYPGAPPRIPHGLTKEEFQTTTCNSCHERGGFSPRFGAYVPVTPHPELEACLQCHAGDDEVTGVVLPSHDPNTICRQCHDPGGLARGVAAVQWSSTAWPRLAPRVVDRPPPAIPHDLHMRGNCVACHAGPGAVTEIRTAHPERANCRQCHAVGSYADPGPFSRPLPETGGATEVTRD